MPKQDINWAHGGLKPAIAKDLSESIPWIK